MEIITNERLAELQELCDKATPGPWEQWVDHNTVFAGPLKENHQGIVKGYRANICDTASEDDGLECCRTCVAGGDCEECEWPEVEARANAAFIAAAREALPALIAELRQARERLAMAVDYCVDDRHVVRRRRDAWVIVKTTPCCADLLLHKDGEWLPACSQGPQGYDFPTADAAFAALDSYRKQQEDK